MIRIFLPMALLLCSACGGSGDKASGFDVQSGADGPELAFSQNGRAIAAENIDGVWTVSLQTAPFTISAPSVSQDGQSLWLTLGQEDNLRAQISHCQNREDGPLFAHANAMASAQGPFSTLIIPEPSASTGNIGWHDIGHNQDGGTDANGAVSITSVLELSGGKRREVLQQGQGGDVFLIAYDANDGRRGGCSRREVSTNKMALYRLTFI